MTSAQQRVFHFLGKSLNADPVSGVPGIKRRLAPERALGLLGTSGVSSFKTFVRKFAIYESRGSTNGLHPGAGPGYGTEFVFVTRNHMLTCVSVCDPRTDTISTFTLVEFLKRGGKYWEQNFPPGWATFDSPQPPPATPDLQRAVYAACVKIAASKLPQLPSSKAIADALARCFGVDRRLVKAPFSPRTILRTCALGSASPGRIRWQPHTADAWKMPLFECIETPFVSRLIAHNVGGRASMARGYIQKDETDGSRWVVASLHDIVEVEIQVFARDILTAVKDITSEQLQWADPASSADLNELKRKQSSLAIGEMPPCISAIVYPPQIKNGYPKDAARWRGAGVIWHVATSQGVGTNVLVNYQLFLNQWAMHPVKSMEEMKQKVFVKGKGYPNSCHGMDKYAGTCPYAGDIRTCCNVNNKKHSDNIKGPAEQWTAPAMHVTLKKVKI